MDEQYSFQLCKDKEIIKKFSCLHTEMLEMVIRFCNENHINITDFNLSADGLAESIEHNRWMPSTDSSMQLLLKGKEKPFLWSI